MLVEGEMWQHPGVSTSSPKPLYGQGAARAEEGKRSARAASRESTQVEQICLVSRRRAQRLPEAGADGTVTVDAADAAAAT